MADLGYDVWMGNARGNRYSNKHVYLDPITDYRAYWDFTFEDIAMKDLPLMINYAMNISAVDQLIFIGHSTGATEFLAMAAEQPAINDKISLFVAMAPSSYMSNSKNSFLHLAATHLDTLQVNM